jgi:hypothetical protein
MVNLYSKLFYITYLNIPQHGTNSVPLLPPQVCDRFLQRLPSQGFITSEPKVESSFHSPKGLLS